MAGEASAKLHSTLPAQTWLPQPCTDWGNLLLTWAVFQLSAESK